MVSLGSGGCEPRIIKVIVKLKKVWVIGGGGGGGGAWMGRVDVNQEIEFIVKLKKMGFGSDGWMRLVGRKS